MNKINIFNKKGIGVEEWLKQIPYIILTIVVMGAIFLLINTFINISINVEDLEREVLFNRLMYSPNSIMCTDNVTRTVYPGIIDWNKFTDETLDNAIKYSYERHISAKLELYNSEKELVKTAYLNHEWYDRLVPLAKAGVTGSGSGRLFPRRMPVIYRKNGVNLQGFLRIEIITPR